MLQILFDLPVSERILARCDCTLMGHRVPGTLFLSTHHICFSSMAPSATHPSATRPSSLFSSSPQPTAAVTLMLPLEKVTTMSDSFIRRHRALVFTLLDKTQVEFSKFAVAEAHSEFQQVVRTELCTPSRTLSGNMRLLEKLQSPYAPNDSCFCGLL